MFILTLNFPLSPIYSLAAPFITSCPTTNPALPVKAYPTLTATPAAGLAAGSKITYSFNSTSSSATYYAVFYSGLTTTAVKLASDKSATVPTGLQGTVFSVISTSANVTDASTVAGPLISVFNFGSQ